MLALPTNNQVNGLAISRDERLLVEKLIWGTVRSRHALMVETGFSKTKLNSLITNLMLSDLVIEGQFQPSVGGRRPVGVELNPDFGFLLGIEFGVTSVDVCLSTSNLTVIGRAGEPISIHQGPKIVLRLLDRLIEQVFSTVPQAKGQLIAIGLGIPARVSFPSGMMLNSPLMRGWEGFSFQEYFQSVGFDIPVYVDNEVNMMAFGELWAQRTRQHLPNRMRENIIVLKLGTGIGASLVINGEVFRGDGIAGDLGHTMVAPNGPRCQCGNLGCLEAVAGAPAVLKTVAEAVSGDQQSATFTTYDAVLAMKAGNEAVIEIVQEAGNNIGEVLAGAINILNPHQIVIGGGLTTLGPKLISSIKQSIFAHSSPYSTRLLRIDPLSLGERSALIGACILALLQTIRAGGQV